MKREPWKEILRRNEVKLYVPGHERLVEIAEERTAGMVRTFNEAVTRVSWMKVFDAIAVLARSCYLQGIRDSCDAIAKRDLDVDAAQRRKEGKK